ncbi:mas-related G-protein coupled receptor member H-like [Python bivittatus]|uniref:Mas-related G-protein coupled receptor member H-like n=1 Tax=Python bivittatus TaxID=176946 RepID=A0A9F5JC29_PYTBI|nr:mas-related G-protein coupled receptor member H-like [Python bivittatus]
MAEFGSTPSFASEVIDKTYDNSNWTDFKNSLISNIPIFTENVVLNVILLTLCFLGLLGNGKVIWILGFHMKRNSFSIYILNLAVADSGVLIMQALTQISQIYSPNNLRIYLIFNLIYFVAYNTSQLLLISISVDRCVSVLFPMWHRCRRPPKLSLIVCAISWVLPIVFFGLEFVVIFSQTFLLFQLIFNGLISYTVMVISTLILLVKLFFKQRQQKWKKVLTVTLLALLCFIVFRLPLSIFSIISYSILKNIDLKWVLDELLSSSLIENEYIFDFVLTVAYNMQPWLQSVFILMLLSEICITVNSSINPILYFLAGRKKEDRSRVSMKLALHRVFRNEEDSREDEMQTGETRL